MLNATDKFLVNDGSVTETVTWSEIKGGINPLVVSVVITPNEPVVNFEVTATPVLTGGEEPYNVTGYQWHTSDDDSGTNQTPIAGATQSTYTPVSADADKFLGCTVTATDSNGVSVEGTGYADVLTDMGLVLATPSVLTPPDGAGIGGTIQYTPETSAITAGGVETTINSLTLTKITWNVPQVMSSWAVFGIKVNGQFITDSTLFTVNSNVTTPEALWDGDETTSCGLGAGQGVDPVIEVDLSGFGPITKLEMKDYGDSDGYWDNYQSNGRGEWLAYNGSEEVILEKSQVEGYVWHERFGGSELTKLTLTNDISYNAETGDEMDKIDNAFKAGTKVTGDGEATVFANTPCFSTKAYEGDGTQPRQIETGIDNTGKSLIWVKNRTTAYSHYLFDSERIWSNGNYSYLNSDSVNKGAGSNTAISSFDSDGFTYPEVSMYNNSLGENYVAWNFRAAPKFFDVVTYDGNGTAQEVPHSLGSAPGMILIKATSKEHNWRVYHKSTGKDYYASLNDNLAFLPETDTGYAVWNNTEPTSSVFSVGTAGTVNENGQDYVAYLFADTPGLIKCGEFTGASSGNSDVVVDCGFKPGWVLTKNYENTSGGGNWKINDTKFPGKNFLMPNKSDAEVDMSGDGTTGVILTDTGFIVEAGFGSAKHIYVAIAEDASAGEFMPTGVLTEDANPSDPSITLTDVTGTWAPGLSAIADEQVNREPPGWIPGEEFNYHPTTSEIEAGGVEEISSTKITKLVWNSPPPSSDAEGWNLYGIKVNGTQLTDSSLFTATGATENISGFEGIYQLGDTAATMSAGGGKPICSIEVDLSGFNEITSLEMKDYGDGSYWQGKQPNGRGEWLAYNGDTEVLLTKAESNGYAWYSRPVIVQDLTTLTFTENKVYKEDGTEVQLATIDQKFKAGDTVTGDSTAPGTPAAAAFSTTLYPGDAFPGGDGINRIDTGIDNTSKSLVWIKARQESSNGYEHHLFDTERGVEQQLQSNSTIASTSYPNSLVSFESNGFGLKTESGVNSTGKNFVAWNFRGAPGFFEVVTYEGDAEIREIPHELGSVPGVMIVKSTSRADDWNVYHKELGNDGYLRLNQASAAETGRIWGYTDPTDKVITIGKDGATNMVGEDYVAYLFADTPGLIKCGSYPTTATTTTIDVGFKPGWVLTKNATYNNSNYGWDLWDSERVSGEYNLHSSLSAESSSAEFQNNSLQFTDTGFTVTGNSQMQSPAGHTVIYIAIAEDASAGQFPPTGTLTADADKDSKTMTLTDVSGTWAPGIKAINDKELTGETPTVADIEFTSTQPATESGEVTTWGSADWQVARDSSFTVGLQEASVQLADTNPEQGPDAFAFNLTENTEYYVRTKYNSLDPTEVSEWSSANHFLMGGYPSTGAYGNFSTTLYPGTGAQQPIDTGVDNTTKSMVWIKNRSDTKAHQVFDTIRGPGNVIHTNDTIAAADDIETLSSFSSNGFTVGTRTGVNASSNNYVAWNFAAAEGFFDIVTYTGNSTAGSPPSQTIPHSLGTEPGMMLIKGMDNVEHWGVYHKDLGNDKFLMLNLTSAVTDTVNWWGGLPTATEFNVGFSPQVNELNKTFVAYLFADNPEGGIKCGTYIGDSGTNNEVECGFKPGWVMLKRSNNVSEWFIFDAVRGTANRNWLQPDNSNAESVYVNNQKLAFTDTGFTITGADTDLNNSGDTFIYVAIADSTVTFFDEKAGKTITNHTIVKRYGKDPSKLNLKQYGIYELTEQPTYSVDAYVPENGKYKPIRSYLPELNRANARIAEIKQAFADRLDALETATTVEPTPEPTPIEPFAVDGYYPLYSTEEAANAASDAGTNHSHTLNGVEYYMPDGGTLYHGDYGDSSY